MASGAMQRLQSGSREQLELPWEITGTGSRDGRANVRSMRLRLHPEDAPVASAVVNVRLQWGAPPKRSRDQQRCRPSRMRGGCDVNFIGYLGDYLLGASGPGEN